MLNSKTKKLRRRLDFSFGVLAAEKGRALAKAPPRSRSRMSHRPVRRLHSGCWLGFIPH